MGSLRDDREPIVTVKTPAFEVTGIGRRGAGPAMFAKRCKTGNIPTASETCCYNVKGLRNHVMQMDI